MARPGISTEVRENIIAGLVNGESHRVIAARVGYSKALVSKVAAESGAVYDRSQIKTVIDSARRDYDTAARIALINKVFAKVESLIETIEKPTQAQSLAITIGILVDKRRLEDGDVTSRTEIQTDDGSADFDRRIVDILARRRASGGGGRSVAGSTGMEAATAS